MGARRAEGRSGRAALQHGTGLHQWQEGIWPVYDAPGGGAYYMPQYEGTDVTYVTVEKPD